MKSYLLNQHEGRKVSERESGLYKELCRLFNDGTCGRPITDKHMMVTALLTANRLNARQYLSDDRIAQIAKLAIRYYE